MNNSTGEDSVKHEKAAGEEDDDVDSEEDQFSRLPDELLILILTKIHQPDFKFLCQCSLVSKRFSLSIPLMPTVSISIFSPIPNSNSQSFEDVADRFIDRKMQYLTSLRPQIYNAVNFLKKFHKIRSLHIVFDDDDDDDDVSDGYGFSSSLLNWKTKFDFKLQSFAFLFAHSLSRKEETGENEYQSLHVTSDQLELRLYSSFHGVVDSIEWGSVLMSLLIHHPLLCSVTITGSEKGGKMCLKDNELVNLRNSLTPEDILRIGGNGNGLGVTINVKSGYVPVLSLPLSGYIMKGVSLVVVRVGRRLCEGVDEDNSDDGNDDDSDDEEYVDYDDNDIIGWDFDEEEKIFREAVTSILMNHKEKMHRET